MTLPSQQPRSNSPLSTGARQARGMRSLFIAVAALGLGGAAAGWFLTHRSETPQDVDSLGTIVDPLQQASADAAPEAIADAGVTVTEVIELGAVAPEATTTTSTPTATAAAGTAPAPAVTGTATPPAIGEVSSLTPSAAAPLGTAAPGITGTPGVAAPTPAAVIGSPAERLAAAAAMIDTDPVRARAEATRLLDSGALSAAERQQGYGIVNSVAERIFLSPKIAAGDPVSQSYVVRKGDSLARIASREKTGVDWRLIQRVNGLANERAIRPDMRLKLLHGPFHAEVVKSEYRFNVYAGEGADRVMVLTVLCGLGADDSTPTGSFRVRKGSKLVNPAWRNPRTGEQFAADDPANPIGERWIGLEGTDAASARHTGIGIHGTVEQQSIGKQMSMGCVRLGDREVEVAYELIGDGSTVVIR